MRAFDEGRLPKFEVDSVNLILTMAFLCEKGTVFSTSTPIGILKGTTGMKKII